MISKKTTSSFARQGRTAIRLVIVFAVCLLSAVEIRADEASPAPPADIAKVDVRVSKSAVQVAEPLTFELQVTANPGTRVVFPAISKQLGDFDVIAHRDRFDIPTDAGQRIWTRLLTLESIATGELEIPALEIQAVLDDQAQTIRSSVIPVRVLSVLEDRADPTQFRDIHSVVDVALPQPDSQAINLWLATAAVGILLLATATVVLLARRKSWLAPPAWALQEIDALKKSLSNQELDSEQALQTLTSIVRDYLEMQFEISAPVQTTEEFLRIVEAGDFLDAATVKQFGQLFACADQAKFAGVQYSPAELDSAIDDACRLIEQTSSALQRQSPSPRIHGE
jgi:hypothetical protein